MITNTAENQMFKEKIQNIYADIIQYKYFFYNIIHVFSSDLFTSIFVILKNTGTFPSESNTLPFLIQFLKETIIIIVCHP